MNRYILSPEAKTDIANILIYTNKHWGKEQSEKYILQIRGRLQWLADQPMLGRSRDAVKEGYRSFNEGSHTLFYRVTSGNIEIIGIPHQSMDVEL